MPVSQCKDYNTLQNFGYQRDYNNDCTSNSIVEDIIYLVNNKELLLMYVDFYLAGHYGQELEKQRKADMNHVSYIARYNKRGSYNDLIIRNIIANAINADSMNNYDTKTIRLTLNHNCVHTIRSYYNELIDIFKLALEP